MSADCTNKSQGVSDVFRPYRSGLELSGALCMAGLLMSCVDGSGEDVGLPPAGTFRVSVSMPVTTAMDAHGGTLFSIVSADGMVRATAGFSKTWNTYCASNPLQVHFFLENAGQFPLAKERLSNPHPELRTAYGFSAENALI